jgi:hypothetical protein
MPLDVKRVVDSCVRFKKPLRGRPALEALHLTLPSSNGEMRVLCAIVFTQTSRLMTIGEAQAIERRAIRTQPVGNDGLWLHVLILQ